MVLSSLGPLLFLLYVNDVKNASSVLDPIMFADDTKLCIRTFKMVDVTISEVRLKTLMKEIFKEKFEKQQKQKCGAYRDSARNVVKAEKKVDKLEEQINEL